MNLTIIGLVLFGIVSIPLFVWVFVRVVKTFVFDAE